MISKAKTVKEYLNSLPKDRRGAISAVRKVILANLSKGFEERMQYGMITYAVPLKIFPEGYGGRKNEPLPMVSLGSQKNYMALYLMCVYGNPQLDAWFRKEYKASGKKLDMGMGCLRFKKLDNLPLAVIGKLMKKCTMQKFIEIYKKAREKRTR